MRALLHDLLIWSPVLVYAVFMAALAILGALVLLERIL
jgi:hypothetical protein